MSKKILVVDDEKMIVKGIKFSLIQDYSVVDCAYDGEEALDMAKNNDYDIILLDIMLPKMNGLEVCQQIREFSNVPIIMLTAKGDDMDKIMGLEYGADDYITKPVTMPLVIRRIEAVLRRTEKGNQNENTIIHYKEISLDIDSFNVFVNGESIPLTTREFEILKLFLENQGRVFTRDNLLNTIWGYDYFGDAKIVNTHIKNIRRKLGVDYIETIRGVGYKIEKENQ